MKQNKSVYDSKREFKKYPQRKQFSQEKSIIIAKTYKNIQNYGETNEFGCQCDSRRNYVTCLREQIMYPQIIQQKNIYSKDAKEAYTYFSTRYSNEIGVSSIRALKRRKVKKIYLPETNDAKVGSSRFGLLPRRISRRTPKMSVKISSKCIGGVVELKQPSLINAKISPIIKTRSGVTSPMSVRAQVEQQTNVDNPKIIHATTTTVTQNSECDCKDIKSNDESAIHSEEIDFKEILTVADTKKTDAMVTSVVQVTKSGTSKKGVKELSSNSLVQNVHDLENPCDDEQSYSNAIDPMENKLEREYRRMFSTKSKEHKLDEKSIVSNERSTFRRRFDALRRSARKEDDVKNESTSKETCNTNDNTSRKDASIISDPPSLEGRSFYEMKTFSPSESHQQDCYPKPKSSFKKSSIFRKHGDLPDDKNTSKQGVKGMFKLWGKKFNLEKEANIKKSALKNESDEEAPRNPDKKKEDKRFSFMKKKLKENIDTTYHSPDGVTTGRCEVKDGLTITIGKSKYPIVKEVNRHKKEGNEITRQTWLKKFLTRAVESKDRVHLRWNNNSYATSNSYSTVLGLMDTIYKSNGVVITSQSDFADGSFYSRTPTVHNYNRKTEAWMIPHILTFRQHLNRRKSNQIINYYKGKNIRKKYSDNKYYVEKLEPYGRTDIHDTNTQKISRRNSSNYFTMGIPKCGPLDMSSEVQCGHTYQSSEEEVYKIVEYETPNSDTNLKRVNKIDEDVQIGDYLINAKTIYDEVIKRNEAMDIKTQASETVLHKRHDIIHARVITQRDTEEVRTPILKFQSDASSVESNPLLHTAKNKCELSPNYLQEYYKHFTLLGVDFLSWCVSNSHIKCCFEDSKSSININKDNSKSCPNIYESYQTAVKISSIITTHNIEEEEKKKLEILGSKYFRKFLIKRSRTGKRILPKDSLEVFRKRRIYSKVKSKSKWIQHNKEVTDRPVHLKGDPKNLSVRESLDISNDKIEKHKIKKTISLPECNVVIKKILILNKSVTFEDNEFAKKLDDPFSTNISVSNISVGHPNSECSLASSHELENNPSRDSVSHQLLNVSNLMFRRREKSLRSNKNFYLDFNNDHLDFMSNSDYQLRSKTKKSEPREIKLCIKKSRKYASRLNPLGSIMNKEYPSTPRNTQVLPSENDKKQVDGDNNSLHDVRNANNKNEVCCSPCRKQTEISSAHNIDEKKVTDKISKSEYNDTPKACLSNDISHSRLSHCSYGESTHNKCQCSGKINNEFILKSDATDSEVDRHKERKPKDNKMAGLNARDYKIAEENKDDQMFEDSKIANTTIKKQALNNKIQEEMLKSCQEQLQHLNNKLIRIQKCAMNEFSDYNDKDNDTVVMDDVVKLSSGERIPINLKPSSPSTEEIREPPNCIKLRDEDGITYLERKKYNTDEAIRNVYSKEDIEPILEKKCNKNLKPNNLNTEEVRMFPNSIKHTDQDGNTYIEKKKYYKDQTLKDGNSNEIEPPLQEKSDKIEANKANLVEIHFKLKLKQGDKTTEININADKEKHNKQRREEIYVMNNDKLLQSEGKKEPTVDIHDINIEIFIKNLKTKPVDQIEIQRSKNRQNEEFSKTISDKFKAVTKSNNIVNVDENPLSAYSVNRADIESTLLQTKISKEVVSNSFIHKEAKHENIMPLPEIYSLKDQMPKVHTEHSVENVQISSGVSICQSNNEIQKFNEDTEGTRASSSSYNQDKSLYNNTTDEEAPKRFHMSQLKYEEKKEMLKKLIKQASKIEKTGDKKKKRQIKDAMKAILTSESDLGDRSEIKGKLAKDVTYTSLKPFFRTTDSMNNYYPNEDSFYETDQNESCTMNATTASATGSEDCVGQRCTCREMAAKLNLSNIKGGCCCCRPIKLKGNVLTECNISSQSVRDDYKKYAEAATQNSEFWINRFVNTKSSLEVVNTDAANFLEQKNSMTKNYQASKKHKESAILNDEILVMKTEHTNAGNKRSNKIKEISLKPSDYLQSNEAKEAVLKIYAEKIYTKKGEHYVARLPKYVYENEIDIQRNYDKLLENRSVLISTRR